MDNETVDPRRHSDISHIFHILRAIGVCPSFVTIDRESLRGDYPCSGDMGGRSRLPDVGHGRRNTGACRSVLHPNRGHRYRSREFRIHAVTDVCPSALVGLTVVARQVIFLHQIPDSLIVLHKQLTECPPPVPQETLALPGAADDFSGQDGEPGTQVISPAVPEFTGEIRGPCERTRLVTVS